VVYGVLTYTEAAHIDPQELAEANAALDRYIRERNRKNNGGLA